MAHSENNTLSSAFKTFFERETLTGPNFNDWYRSLRIVLRVADTFDYLYKPCPGQPADTATEAEKAAFKAEYKKHSDVACIMLGKMSPALQRQFENYPPQNMLAELRKMFEKPPAVEIYDLVDALHSCRQAPGKPVSEHVLEMKGLMDQLHTLGKPYDNDMAVNLINRSLNKDFGDFVRNFNMHCVGKTVTELHALLIDFEKGLKDKAPTPQVFTIQKGRDNKPKPQANKKVKGKGKADKNKQVVPYQPKPKPNPLKRKENPNKDQACHHCHVAGHWKRNCPLYIEELRANKKKSEPGAAKEKLSYGDLISASGSRTQAAVEAIECNGISVSLKVPTKEVDRLHMKCWHEQSAENLSYLKVWGCEAYVKRDSADKLQQRSVKPSPNAKIRRVSGSKEETGMDGKVSHYTACWVAKAALNL
ncbi:retrotransposon protein, putative, ty1-copia subclass [Tanacetum coccineum]